MDLEDDKEGSHNLDQGGLMDGLARHEDAQHLTSQRARFSHHPFSMDPLP